MRTRALSLLPLLSLLLLTTLPAHPAHAQTTTINGTLNNATYTYTLTPLSSLTPSPSLSLTTSIDPALFTLLPSRTSSTPLTPPLPLGFPFLFYGNAYTTVRAHLNGALFFRVPAATTTLSLSAASLPTSLTVASTQPILAFYTVSTASFAANDSSYVTVGTAPSRIFVYRVSTMRYSSASSSSAPPLSFDVLLYETTNVIEVRYYALTTTTSTVLIGLMAGPWRYLNSVADFTAPLNAVAMSTAQLAVYNASSLTFTPQSSSTLPNVTLLPSSPSLATLFSTQSYTLVDNGGAPTTPLSLRSPNITYILPSQIVATVPLGFTFTYCSQPFRTVSISLYGNLQFATALTSKTLISWGTTLASAVPIFFAFQSDFAPSSAFDRSVERSWERAGTYPDRTFIVRFFQMPYVAGPSPQSVTFAITLFERDSSIRVDYYRASATPLSATSGVTMAGLQCRASPLLDWSFDGPNYVPAVAGPTASVAATSFTNRSITYVPTTPIAFPPTYSDLSSVTVLPVVASRVNSYNAFTLAASSLSSSLSNPVALTLPLDGTPLLVPIGFNMPVLNDRYSHVYLSLHGYMRFAHYTTVSDWSLVNVTTVVTSSSGNDSSSTNATTTTNTTWSVLSPWTLPLANDADAPLLAFAAGAWTRTSSTTVQVQRAGSASTGLRTFVLRFTNLAYLVDPTKSLVVQVTFNELTSVILIEFGRVDAADTPITIGGQGLPLSVSTSLIEGVSVPSSRNVITHLNASSLLTWAPVLTNQAFRWQPANLAVPRPSFLLAPRSYVVQSTTIAYTSASIAAPPPSSSPAWTILAQGPRGTTPTLAALPIDLGFTFYFFGQPYSRAIVHIGTGMLYFGNYSTPPPFTALTSTPSFPVTASVPPFLCFFGSSMQMVANSTIASVVEGDAPTRRFILRFDQVQLVGSSTSTYPANATFHVILYEADGSIWIPLSAILFDSANAEPGAAIGVQNTAAASTALRVDLLPDTVPFSWSGLTAVDVRNQMHVFTWQSDASFDSANNVLNIGVPTLRTSSASSARAVATRYEFDPKAFPAGTATMQFALFCNSSKQALLLAYGASVGQRMRMAMADVMGFATVESVVLLDVSFYDAKRAVRLGNTTMTRVDLVAMVMVVRAVVLPGGSGSGGSSARPEDAVRVFASAAEDATLTSRLWTQPNVFNAYANGNATNVMMAPSTIASAARRVNDAMVGAGAASAAVMTLGGVNVTSEVASRWSVGVVCGASVVESSSACVR